MRNEEPNNASMDIKVQSGRRPMIPFHINWITRYQHDSLLYYLWEVKNLGVIPIPFIVDSDALIAHHSRIHLRASGYKF